MDFKDYYTVLGVAPNADDHAIKQAYRTLARQYHPDVNPGDKQAEDRFKEINEAFQALSDPERRKKYDQLRQNYQHWQQRGGREGFNWGQWEAAPGQSVHTRSVSPEDFEDLFGGTSPFSDFFSSIYGGMGDETGRGGRPRRGRDHDLSVEITLEEAFHGTARTIQVGDHQVEARIPPGVRSGSRVRLAGQGSAGAAGGSAGDLYLLIEVVPNARFERDGDNLTCDVPIDIFTAAAGGDVRVQTLDGAVSLKIPLRTQAGKTFRLRGKGMPRLGRPSERGDLYAKVKLVLPEPLRDDELEMLRALARSRQAQARQ